MAHVPPEEGKRKKGGMSREVQLSKALSKLLRHKASEAGIALDGEGFAPLDAVLAYGPIKSLKPSVGEIKSIVADNAKQRFLLRLKHSGPDTSNAGDYVIRANQGHSIPLDSASMMQRITLEAGNVPPRVVHGTYFAFWPAIVASGGLLAMGRNHVHCSTGDYGGSGVTSGMRADAELLIEVDVERSLREGGSWWRSDNGVVLAEGGVDARFFRRVTGRAVDVGVLWEDGEQKRELVLPEGVRARVPRGKAR